MDPFTKKPPHRVEILMHGYMRLYIGIATIPQLIARICGCLYYSVPIIWDEKWCNNYVILNENKTIATSNVWTSGYRNAFVIGDYNDETDQIFKFKLVKHTSIYFGISTESDPPVWSHCYEGAEWIKTIQVGEQEGMYCLRSWNGGKGAICSGKESKRLVDGEVLKDGDIITININNGCISFYVNDTLIGSQFKLTKGIKFKVGASMDRRGDQVQIIDSWVM